MKISDAKLSRISNDAKWAFGTLAKDQKDYFWHAPHGNLFDSTGRILHEQTGSPGSSAAMHLAQHADPITMIELLRGYRLAKKANLL